MGTLILFFITVVAYTCANGTGTDGTSGTNQTAGPIDSYGADRPSNDTDTVVTILFTGKSDTSIIKDRVDTQKSNDNGKVRKTIGTEETSNIADTVDVEIKKDTDQHVYSDKFIMKTNLSQTEVELIASRNGFELKKKVLDKFYVLKRKTTVPRMSKKPITLPANTTLKKHPMIESFEQERYLKLYRRQFTANGTASPARKAAISRLSPVITDDRWADMWYLHNDTKPSMGIYQAWSRGYTGRGVTIAFLDDGVDTRHTDLMANYRSELSYNFNYDRFSPDHSYSDNGHGTSCAGVVSAVKNNKCILGVAYNSRFAALKILDDDRGITASDQAMAFNRHYDEVDIYSNSWGPSDDGDVYNGPREISVKALASGVFKGRNGKGSIYVFASGNGGQNDDDCNCDGFSNSIYTVTINSVSNTGDPAYYAEKCTAVLATTYGGDFPNPMLVTTNRSNTCTKTFQGTSASAPVATGIIALTLEANPDLTWRDVQHLIVETSSHSRLKDSEGFTYNGVGKKVSRYHGFGLMNANDMISRALSWKTVPEQVYSRTSYIYSSTRDGAIIYCFHGGMNKKRITRGYFSTSSTARISTPVKYIEHVTVFVDFKISTRGNAIFHLTSPSGTKSKLLGARSRDITFMANFMSVTFSSVQTWGEDPSGTWTLQMTSAGYQKVELSSWRLTIYGTLTNPLRGAPIAGSFGGSCLKDNKCTDSDHCCDEDLELCFIKSEATCVEESLTTTENPWDYWLDGDEEGGSGAPNFRNIWLTILVSAFFVQLLL